MMPQTTIRVSEDAAQVYEDIMVPAIYDRWATFVVDLVAPRRGDRALDVACGTGVVTRLLASRITSVGEVTGLDCDAAMLAVARNAARGKTKMLLTWEETTVTTIPYPEESFDIVTCQQGLPYFPNKATALHELYRVLAPGGRLGMMCWQSIDQSPGFERFAGIMELFGGQDAGNLVREAFSMNNPDEIHHLMMQARFRNIHVERASGYAHFRSIDDMFKVQVLTVGLASYLQPLQPEARKQMYAMLTNALQPYINEHGLIFPMGAFLISGKK